MIKMAMPKLFRAARTLVSRNAAVRDVEPVSIHANEGRMILSLSICLVVSIIVVAIADEIERRTAARGDGIDGVDVGAGASSTSSNLHAKSHRNRIISPVAARNSNNEEQSTLQELDDLFDDIVKSSTMIKEDASKSTRQFDEMMKYDQFLKLIKS